jgi:hypothetical protein
MPRQRYGTALLDNTNVINVEDDEEDEEEEDEDGEDGEEEDVNGDDITARTPCPKRERASNPPLKLQEVGDFCVVRFFLPREHMVKK